MVKEAQIELAVKACVWCDYREIPYYPENIVMALDNLGFLSESRLTQRAADAPKAAAICTCSMDDGIHEWNCALNTAHR